MIMGFMETSSKYLFFDTETSGLPRDYKADWRNTGNWPRIVQLAWIVTDSNGGVIDSCCDIIKPNGFVIPENMIHGISNERALAEGISCRVALMKFAAVMQSASALIAHNSAFDSPVVAAEMVRHNGELSAKKMMLEKKAVCTMDASTEFCAIPSPYKKGYYKWPRLEELYLKLFGEKFDGAHDALADVSATVRCFFELVKLGVIDKKLI